ncbi:YihY family inner membrane protein [Limnohabitans sp.]|uniref:YihY family inner membrane protein n=1 Tax=Limnohabitans sp. TaxID=1907725 RepID=UPI00286EC9EB|nr:YihY family inner membrane protein [Limnohabitans sp.]
MNVTQLQDFFERFARFPWRNTARTLRQRFREDRLGQTAGSLTFTTTIALVPMVTVALAVFTAFPVFGDFQIVLQKRLVESLVPDNISRQVLGYLTLFASKASRLGVVGVTALLLSALALVFTIDRTLNAIWRVRKRRPLAHSMLLYWTAITLGPLLMGASLVMMSQFVAVSRGVVPDSFGNLRWLFSTLEFLLLAWAVSALYRFVPYTQVRWTHALLGGVWVAAATEVARKVLAYYFGQMPAYSVVYGAFATVPILLVWIYLAWSIVLIGAVLVANLPSLLGGISRDGRSVGWRFQLALEVLQRLQMARNTDEHGASLSTLCEDLALDPLQIEDVLAALVDLDWIARLSESVDARQTHVKEARYVMLADPLHTPLAPLMERLLLVRSPEAEGLWMKWQDLRLRDVL